MKDYIKYEVKVYSNGTKHWYLNGKRHREDGPAIERSDGTRFWYLSGNRHREDGPAIEYPGGTKCWYLNGKLHREDGPATECSDGTRFWYLNDQILTEKEHAERVNPPCGGKVVEIDGVKYKLVPA